ncbi:MAG TPA: O-antigen ligase family protein [Solirubrobacteraceae bacterium]|nr:O-antigen ligase family protein [Solirubrobacteraceae bacterium]
MSTTLAERLVPPPPAAEPVPPPAPVAARGGAALLLGLFALIAFAAFAGGATTPGRAVFVEVGIALLALVAVALWAARTGLRSAASPVAWTGAGLLAALAIWCALTIPSSLAPDASWNEANRVLAYAIAVGVTLVAGTAAPRAVGLAARAWVTVAALVALYAVATKVAPGVLHAGRDEARLHVPLETFGALAAFCAFGAPVAVRLAGARTDGATWRRLVVLAAAVVLLVALGLTWSRTGMLGLAVGSLVAIGIGGDRLRALALLAVAVAGAAPALAYAWSREALTLEGATLDARIDDGRTLGLLVAGGLLLALLAGFAVLRATRRPAAGPRRRRGLQGWVVLAVGGGVLVAVVAATLASDWDTFKGPVQTSPAQPERLTATDSGNRWALWEEAAGAWDDHPLDGWGAGSFAVNHLRYRKDETPARHAFSLPMDLLAETGAIGLALALAGFGCLGVAAVARLRMLPEGEERDLAGALVGTGAAALVVALVEPIWEVPAVALPPLVLLAVVAARPRPGAATAPAAAFADPEAEPGAGRRPWGRLALACVLLGAVAASAILPAWSRALETSAAETAADVHSTGQQLETAASDARVAADLNPAAASPLQVASAVAERRSRLLEARELLLEAADRQPDRAATWEALTHLAFRLADREGALAAARRALELDPMSSERRALAREAEAALAPPESSATATGTPLPAATAP